MGTPFRLLADPLPTAGAALVHQLVQLGVQSSQVVEQRRRAAGRIKQTESTRTSLPRCLHCNFLFTSPAGKHIGRERGPLLETSPTCLRVLGSLTAAQNKCLDNKPSIHFASPRGKKKGRKKKTQPKTLSSDPATRFKSQKEEEEQKKDLTCSQYSTFSFSHFNPKGSSCGK